MPKRIIVILLLSCVLHSTANSQDDSPNIGWEFVSYEEIITVQKDGRFTRESASVILLTHPRGLAVIGQRKFPHSENLQKLDVIEAYTLKKNGEKLHVSASSIFTKSEAVGGAVNTPIFQDRKVTTIVFPNLEVGASVHSRTRLIQTTPLFPGHFSLNLTFNQQSVWRYAKVSVTVPNDFALFTKTSGVQGDNPVSNGNTTTWTWLFANNSPQRVESSAVNQAALQPYIQASSFKNYSDLAAAYQVGARGKAAVTPRIQQLTDEITAGITDKREQAKHLYQWVARNIRYVAIYLGDGGVVPHDAQSVLDNRYGDCKDHVVLLEALLAARGIESTPVLIDIRPNYSLPDVPIPGAFSHVITYIPNLNMYVDSTNPHAPFGVLPFEDTDKPVIHTAAYGGIQRTPPTGSDNIILSKTTISIAEDGSATGEFRVDAEGNMGITMRRFARAIPPSKISEFVIQSLSKIGIIGNGTIVWKDNAKTGSHTFTLRYKTKSLLNMSAPGAIALRPLLENTPSLNNVMQSMTGPDRKYPYACAAQTMVEEYEIVIPDNIKIIALPNGMAKESVDANYKSNFHLDGKILRVSRTLENKVQGNVCQASRFNELRPFTEAVFADLKNQVLYQPL